MRMRFSQLLVLLFVVQFSAAAHAVSCDFLLKVAQSRISNFFEKKPKIGSEDRSDYQPELYRAKSLADRHIFTYQRIQNRNIGSAQDIFFYDYEVENELQTISRIMSEAQDFSAPKNEFEKKSRQLFLEIQSQLKSFLSQKTIPYLQYHDFLMSFATFQKKGLKNTKPFQPLPLLNYAPLAHKEATQMVQVASRLTGFDELFSTELTWQVLRHRLLRKGPTFLFLPTFETLDENYFIRVNPYPLFVVGLTRDVHVAVDGGQVFGPLMFLLHDFYHAQKSVENVDYSPYSIEARVKRNQSFYQKLEGVNDSALKKMILVLKTYLLHEERVLFLCGTTIESRSADLADSLSQNRDHFHGFLKSVYSIPYDYGGMFENNPPPREMALRAREWLQSFFEADPIYP